MNIISANTIFLSQVMIKKIGPVLNVWVFIAQLVEHYSSNAEIVSSNPIEFLKFCGVNLQLLK